MQEFIATEDIYDQAGRLLISKGHPLTQSKKERLIRLGIEIPEHQRRKESPFEKQTKELMDLFISKLGIKHEGLITTATDMISSIIFDSKHETWWYFIKAISNSNTTLYPHSINVSMLAIMIGERMLLSQQALYDLGIGGLLHDTGMLFLPSSAFETYPNLSAVDRTIIERHCNLGLDALKDSQLSQNIQDIILQHHERIDGSGYPQCLDGQNINPLAQIVMVADYFDIMTSYYPGTSNVSIGDVLFELSNQPNKFPYDVVAALSSCFAPEDNHSFNTDQL